MIIPGWMDDPVSLFVAFGMLFVAFGMLFVTFGMLKFSPNILAHCRIPFHI